MAEEEQQKEAQNQEQNAEATEAVEAGAEAVEETAGAEPKAPSVLVPMLLSAVITVVGVGVMVAVILPGQISKAIADASHHDGNSTEAHDGKEGDSHGGKEGDSHEGEGDSHEGEGETEEGDAAGAVEDDPKKPEPIVPEGENIVINPAGSGGTRYLLVEIFLLRKDVEDKKFPAQVLKSTQLLQAVTVETLSAQSAQALADPATKERLKHTLKLAFQEKLGEKHPIKELIVSKWIMQ